MTPEAVMPKENLDLIKFSRISDTSRKRCFIILFKHSNKGEYFTGKAVSKTDFIFGFIIFLHSQRIIFSPRKYVTSPRKRHFVKKASLRQKSGTWLGKIEESVLESRSRISWSQHILFSEVTLFWRNDVLAKWRQPGWSFIVIEGMRIQVPFFCFNQTPLKLYVHLDQVKS